jgi:hypothetical protein
VNATEFDPTSYARYCATVAKVTTHPGLARSLPCLVCGDSHSFDSCPVLQTNDFLKEHYIAFGSFLKRDTGIRQHRTGSVPPLLPPPRPGSVNPLPRPLSTWVIVMSRIFAGAENKSRFSLPQFRNRGTNAYPRTGRRVASSVNTCPYIPHPDLRLRRHHHHHACRRSLCPRSSFCPSVGRPPGYLPLSQCC